MNQVLTQSRPIRLKGRSFLALVLSPELPLDGWLDKLDDLAARSVGFFLNRPIVLDLENVTIERPQLVQLLEDLVSRGVWITGFENARPSLLGPGMPPAMRADSLQPISIRRSRNRNRRNARRLRQHRCNWSRLYHPWSSPSRSGRGSRSIFQMAM